MKKMICIVCPVGCHLSIDDQKNISGNRCKRGIDYALSELHHPTRVLTTTVRIKSAVISRLSVKSKQPLPKAVIGEVMNLLNQLEINPPIALGDVILSDVVGTGVDIVATRRIEK